MSDTESRRDFFGAAGKLSAVAVALLGGKESLAQGLSTNAVRDSSILNVALGLEHEAIAAYELGAKSGLLQKPVSDVALLFQSHHKEHRDALIATIQKLGARPVAERALDDYARILRIDSLKSQADVVAFAARLELNAANAYINTLPALADPELSRIAGRLAADETMHWTVLTSALGRALPARALSFGG